jgi:hypothetical protein
MVPKTASSIDVHNGPIFFLMVKKLKQLHQASWTRGFQQIDDCGPSDAIAARRAITRLFVWRPLFEQPAPQPR